MKILELKKKETEESTKTEKDLNFMTRTVLVMCKKYGYQKVVIVRRAHGGDEVHAMPGTPTDDSPVGWPAIWGILKDMGIAIGAGNGHAHQVVNDVLDRGTYLLDKMTI